MGSCTLDEPKAQVARETAAAHVPLAARIAANAPVYDCERIRTIAADAEGRRAVMAEWIWVLAEGPASWCWNAPSPTRHRSTPRPPP